MECDGILRKALAIDDLPEDFDPNKVPQTGEEYIHYVMYEAKNCEEWVTADIDKEKFRSKQTSVIEEPTGCVCAPIEMLPTLKWQQETVSDFSAFRLHVQKLKDENPIENGPAFNGESEQWRKKCAVAPKLSDMLNLNQRDLCKVLNFHIAWLSEVTEGNSISQEFGTWLYAILACLETPLMPETCANLRAVARNCSQIRAKLPKDSEEEKYKPLNLFICLIARYFNNSDLIDYVNEM